MSSVQFSLEEEESLLPKLEALHLGVEAPTLGETDTIEMLLLFLLCLTLLGCFFRRICTEREGKKRE